MICQRKNKGPESRQLSGPQYICAFQDVVFYGDFRYPPDSATSVCFELAGMEQVIKRVVPDFQSGTGFLCCEKVIIFSEHKGPPFLLLLMGDGHDSTGIYPYVRLFIIF